MTSKGRSNHNEKKRIFYPGDDHLISPVKAMLSSLRIEGERSSNGMSFVLSGIMDIAEYTNEKVLLKSHGGRIVINGKRLKISIYESSAVEVSGRISGVEFFYGKN